MDRVGMRRVLLVFSLLLVCTLPAAAQDIRTVARTSPGAAAPASPATGRVADLPEGAQVRSLAVDAHGNLYIAVDELPGAASGSRIFRLEPQGHSEEITGNAGPAAAAAVDTEGDVFIADAFDRSIRRADASTGATTTVVSGDPLSHPAGLALDRAGNLYVADSANAAVFVLRAGTGRLALVAHVARPAVLAIDAAGAGVYAASQALGQVFRIELRTRAISRVAGTSRRAAPGEPPANGVLAASAPLGDPSGLAVDAAGNLFIADAAQNVIHRVDATTGIISTIAGTGRAGYSGDAGPASEAELNEPNSLVLDRAGNLFFADQGNAAVREVEHAGAPDQASGSVTLICPPPAPGSAACLTFGPQPVAGTTAAQTVVLSNNSSATLVINGISFVGGNAGDFGETTSCGQTLPVGGTCNINVTFTPLATGTRSSNLTVVDSDSSSPQTATITGTGDDYELGAASSGSLTQTVKAGTTANYSLVVTPDMVFSGTVTLICPLAGGLPAKSTCAATPSSVMVTAGTPAPFTVALTTTASKKALGPQREFPSLPWTVFAAILAVIMLLLWNRQSRIAIRLGAPIFALFALFAVLSGCYHHSSTVPGTPTGTYNITFTGNAQNATRAVSLTLIVQ